MFCCVHPELTMETRMGSLINSTTCYQDASNWRNLRPFDSAHEPNNNEPGCNAASSSQPERNPRHEHFTDITTATIPREAIHAMKRSHLRSQVLLCLQCRPRMRRISQPTWSLRGSERIWTLPTVVWKFNCVLFRHTVEGEWSNHSK
jgi:hypothetical protein